MRKGLDKTFLENNRLRSPEFMALPASARGYWLQLQALCSSQENGGRLAGAGKWNNGAWQQAMGNGGGKAAFKTLAGLGLAREDGEDVIVEGYHLESEAKYQASRLNGGKGGQAAAANRAGAGLPKGANRSPSEGAESRDKASGDAQAVLKQRSSAQGEAGKAMGWNEPEGNDGQGNGAECTASWDEPGEAHPPLDDDSAPDCTDEIVERGSEGRLALTSSIGASRAQRGIR